MRSFSIQARRQQARNAGMGLWAGDGLPLASCESYVASRGCHHHYCGRLKGRSGDAASIEAAFAKRYGPGLGRAAFYAFLRAQIVG